MSAKVESEENVELLTNAQLSATRLRLLVNDILDISKIKANQFHLDVRNGNVYSELAPLLRTYESNADVKHLNFVLDWTPTVYVKAKLDWLRVTQIINNLLSNAVKFTHHGEVRVKVELNNSQLVVVVSDTGCGMNPDQLSNLFTPFAQGDVSITRKYGGTGLGMTIVKSIVDMMSGTLEVTSSEGVGTSMTVTLPVSQTSVFEIEEMCAYSEDLQVSAWLKAWGVESKEQTEAIQVSGGWKNIYPDLILDALQKSNNQQLVDPVVRQFVGHVLVVDDDPINRLLFSKQFAKLGIQPVIKNDGVEAYQYIQEHIDKLNLVITDCHMPNLDGYELTRKIRQDPISTHLPVVGCTAEDSKIVVEKAESAGMCSVLYKPIAWRSWARRYRII
ncbi:sensory box sensor histidine kinase [Vibrio ponticus]|nr:sensory box sensor histidine kinase [Vibrio ponticus]